MTASRMNEADATLRGLFVAAAVPPLMFAISVLVIGNGPDAGIGIALGMAALLYLFSLPIVFVLGGPVFMVLRYFNRVRWWSASASGLVVCALIAVCLRHPGPVQPTDLWYVLTGACTALVFWAIWRRGC